MNAGEMPTCNCNICDSKTRCVTKINYMDIVGMASKYTMVVNYCKNCDFIYTLNPFSGEKLSNRYTNCSKFEFDDDTYFMGEDQGYKKRCQRQKQFIYRNIEEKEIKSIFEIGAASGYNLSLYNGMEQFGVEPSPINCKNAKEKYGIQMFCGLFNDYIVNNTGKKWDLLFLSHTLEHIVNPYDFMKKCSMLSSKYIFIEVPTFDYKYSNEPYGMFGEEHVNMFTLKSLQSLMNRCNYHLISAEIYFGFEQHLPAGYPSIQTLWIKNEDDKVMPVILINNSFDLLTRYLSDSKKILKKIKTKINNIDCNEKLAVWGTGHHYSFLLANTTLSKKNIVKVYDSDSRKTGIETSGCKIEHFNPEDITNKYVDTILIASYVAQKAIEKELEQYKDKVKIIALYDF